MANLRDSETTNMKTKASWSIRILLLHLFLRHDFECCFIRDQLEPPAARFLNILWFTLWTRNSCNHQFQTHTLSQFMREEDRRHISSTIKTNQMFGADHVAFIHQHSGAHQNKHCVSDIRHKNTAPLFPHHLTWLAAPGIKYTEIQTFQRYTTNIHIYKLWAERC